MAKYPYIDNSFEIDLAALRKLYDATMVIKYNIENKNNKILLFNTISEKQSTTKAIVHISYLLSQLDKKILIVNLNKENSENLVNYFGVNTDSSFEITKYSNIDFIGIDSNIVINSFINNNLKINIKKQVKFYDLIIIDGPNISVDYYFHIFDMVDSMITIVDYKRNNLNKMKNYFESSKLFNIKSLGIIRN